MAISSTENLQLAAGEMFSVLSGGYRPPPVYSYNMQFLPGVPPFTINVVDAMRHDYQVKLSMSMKTVPIMKPQFALAGDPEVVAFIEETMRKIWTGHITDITEAMWYTRFGAEIVYTRDRKTNLAKFDKMMPFHPRDFRILTREREAVGIRIVSSWGSFVSADPTTSVMNSVHMNGDSAGYAMFAPKCMVYIHGKKFGSFEGISEFEGAYEPWMEKVREGGAISSRSLWFYKNAFDSGAIYHPPGVWTDPQSGLQIPYRDLALKMVESLRNGGGFAIENQLDSNGQPTWRLERAVVNPGGDVLLQYIDHLDHKIVLGTGIPDDVIQQTSGTGSYAGRTIPFIAFLESGTPTVREIVKVVKDQCLLPLAVMNFGDDRGNDWEITEAKVNVDQFLGGDGADQASGKGVAGDGDGDGVPNEGDLEKQQSAMRRAEGGGNGSATQMSHGGRVSQEELERTVDRLGITGLNSKVLKRFGRFIGQPPEVKITYEGRNKRKRMISLPDIEDEIRQMGQVHDVSNEKRDNNGKWTVGGSQSQADHDVQSMIKPHKTDTPAFKNWFGKSKVVDDSGKPMVVYHGTRFGGFSIFMRSRGGFIYTTPSPEYAGTFSGTSQGSATLPVYVKMENPLDLTNYGENEVTAKELEDHLSQFGVDLKAEGVTLYGSGPAWKLIKEDGVGWALHKAGFDGIKLNEGRGQTAFIAFEPEQLKSAVANNGNYDPKQRPIDMSQFSIALDDLSDTQMSQMKFNFNEDEHPRGQPENKGEFTKKTDSENNKASSAPVKNNEKKTPPFKVDTHINAEWDTPHFIFRTPEGKEIGELMLKLTERGSKDMVPANLLVWPEFQRKGYATAFYKHAFDWMQENDKGKFLISRDRTDNAKSLHKSFEKQGFLNQDGELNFADNGGSDDQKVKDEAYARKRLINEKMSGKADQAVVNIPLAKRGNIDNQIDSFKKQQATETRKKHKELESQAKVDRAEAQRLFEIHGKALAETTAAKHGVDKKEAIATMKEMISGRPAYARKFFEKVAEQASSQQMSQVLFNETEHPRISMSQDSDDSTSEKPAKSKSSRKSTSSTSGHWITIGGHSKGGESSESHGHGRTHLFISGSGKILKGPPGLTGSNIRKLSKGKGNSDARKSIAAHAKAHGKTGRTISEQEAKKFGSVAHIKAHQRAKDAAREHGVSTHDVLQNMEEAHKYLHGEWEKFETPKRRAIELTKLTPKRAEDWENSHRDHSTFKDFDTNARTVAIEHPELRLDPDDTGTPAAIWNLIREGKIRAPKLHSVEAARQAAEWVKGAKKKHGVKSEHDASEDTSFDFGFGGGSSGDGDSHDDIGEGEGQPFTEFSQTHDVSGEKRDNSGKWTTGGGSKSKKTELAHKKSGVPFYHQTDLSRIHSIAKNGLQPRVSRQIEEGSTSEPPAVWIARDDKFLSHGPNANINDPVLLQGKIPHSFMEKHGIADSDFHHSPIHFVSHPKKDTGEEVAWQDSYYYHGQDGEHLGGYGAAGVTETIPWDHVEKVKYLGKWYSKDDFISSHGDQVKKLEIDSKAGHLKASVFSGEVLRTDRARLRFMEDYPFVKTAFSDQEQKTIYDPIFEMLKNWNEKNSTQFSVNSSGDHEFSSTQFNIEDGIYSRTQGSPLTMLKAMAATIPDDVIVEEEGGREYEFHITVLYGLHTNDASDIENEVKGFGSVDVTFGKTSIFECNGYDVVKADVESVELRMLNKLMSDSLDHTSTHPRYVPHCTIAYVKSGEGKKYSGIDLVQGMKVSFDELVFSNKKREKTKIDLTSDQDNKQMSQRGSSSHFQSHQSDLKLNEASDLQLIEAMRATGMDMTELYMEAERSGVNPNDPEALKLFFQGVAVATERHARRNRNGESR